MLEWTWCQAFSTSITAYAGLYRFRCSWLRGGGKYPRIRGVVSYRGPASCARSAVSPHTRGCIWTDMSRSDAAQSIPAYAGLYRSNARVGGCLVKYPRIRGVVSLGRMTRASIWQVSPHTRGCIHSRHTGCGAKRSIPAYAGLYRLWPDTVSAPSPHTWGAHSGHFLFHTRRITRVLPEFAR